MSPGAFVLKVESLPLGGAAGFAPVSAPLPVLVQAGLDVVV